MAVLIGSARSSENGTAYGKPGDQKSGKEVSTQSWYKCTTGKGGWRVFRCIDQELGTRIAYAMKVACDNNHIGYNQSTRNTLYTEAKKFGFNPALVTKNVETDCSALVRVCCAYAGIMLANFYTASEPNVLQSCGMFVELTDSKYRNQESYLRVGDILVTPVKGHTVVVLTNGAKMEADVPKQTGLELGDRLLYNGCFGTDVRELQAALIGLGYDCGSYGADGDYGDATQIAVAAFQRDAHIEIDGEFGAESFKALQNALSEKEQPVTIDKDKLLVEIVNGNCYVRTAPNTKADIIGVAKRGEKLTWQGETWENGWQLVIYAGKNAWVSGKYTKLV